MSGWIVTRLRRNGPTHVLSEDGRYVAQRVTPDFLPLVAAAPDLLAIARLYVSECTNCSGVRDVPCDYCEHIWAAIDRAEGRP